VSRRLVVLLDRRPAGVLEQLPGGTHRFTYDDAYRRDPGATPLSASMPLAADVHTDAVVTPWITGLLPDNPDVLRRWAQLFSSRTEVFSLLSTPIGEDCAGAAQLVREERLDALLADTGSIDWLTDHEVGVRLHELRIDETAWLGPEAPGQRRLLGQFSLAGRQRKTALLHEDGRWGVPHGPIPTTHILKPPVERFDEFRLHDQELNEHLCLAAARRAGLVTAESRVAVFGSERAIVLRRYDRRRVGGSWQRVHQEDLCQALSVLPSGKYQREGGPGASRIAAFIRSSMPASVANDDLLRFADALAWSWIIGSPDGHAKNYSILLAGRDLRLAPLYDISSGIVYWKEHDLSLAMKIGDGYALVDHRDPWPAAARALGLSAELVHDRVVELCRRAPDAFAAVASEPDVAALGSSMPAQLTDAVAGRARRCLHLMEQRASSSPPGREARAGGAD
jgi:serine/threonine-protein kinase HipA